MNKTKQINKTKFFEIGKVVKFEINIELGKSVQLEWNSVNDTKLVCLTVPESYSLKASLDFSGF